MSTTTPQTGALATIRQLTFDCQGISNNRTTVAISAHGPLVPAGNQNTNVTFVPDETEPFKFSIRYAEDQVPNVPGRAHIFEFSKTTLVSDNVPAGSEKVHMTVAFMGGSGVEDQLVFDLGPGEIRGLHSVDGKVLDLR